MVTPAESLPINDIEIMQPMQPSINYHSANMSEKLIVDENSRNCFVKDSPNPFRLTSYPRICSYYDLKSTSKGNNDVFDAIVDVVCFYQGVDSNKQDIRISIRNSGFLVAPPKKLENVWEYYFMTCLHNILPFEYEHKNEIIKVSFIMMKGILGKIHRYEPLSARSGNCSVVAKSDLKEEENVKAHPNKDWVLMKMDVPIDIVLDDGQFPESYLIPSISKLNRKSNNDYEMSILAFQGTPTVRDVKNLEQYLDYQILTA